MNRRDFLRGLGATLVVASPVAIAVAQWEAGRRTYFDMGRGRRVFMGVDLGVGYSRSSLVLVVERDGVLTQQQVCTMGDKLKISYNVPGHPGGIIEVPAGMRVQTVVVPDRPVDSQFVISYGEPRWLANARSIDRELKMLRSHGGRAATQGSGEGARPAAGDARRRGSWDFTRGRVGTDQARGGAVRDDDLRRDRGLRVRCADGGDPGGQHDDPATAQHATAIARGEGRRG